MTCITNKKRSWFGLFLAFVLTVRYARRPDRETGGYIPWKSGCCSPSRSQALFHSQAFPIRKRPRLLFSELLDVATGATDCYCEERRIVFGYFHPWNFSGKLIMGVQLLSLAVCTIATSFFAPVIYRLILINRPTKDSRDGTRIV